MANCGESRGGIDTENELKSVDATQKELEDLERQSIEDEVVSKNLDSQSNGSSSEVLETGENLSHANGNSPPETYVPDTSETTRELLNVEGNDNGSSGNLEKANIQEKQLTNANESSYNEDSLELGGKQSGSSNPNAQNAASWQCVGGNEDWDRELQEQESTQLQAQSTALSQCVGGTEDWDKEMEVLGITQPHFKLRKEDAINEDLNIKFQASGESVSEESSLGAVGGHPSPNTAVLQLPMEHGTQSLYHIKWIKWKNLNTPIITQNENGPCPLIALMNVLILQRKISIPAMQEIVSASQLMEYLGDCILAHAPERLTESAQLNYEQNMADAISIMCKLQTGLDVNVKFTGVADFEFTPECVVFDLLNIRLLHGWLVDPQNCEAALAIGNLSYNQLVEKIIASKQDGADPDLVTEGLVAESFLDHSASQLTYHGLYELNAKMGEEELCIFFRNNHFNTLFKHKNELFLLVTDQGYLTEDKVMWETLSNVEGDGYFVDANLQSIPASHGSPSTVPNTAAKLPPGISQEDQDYLVALSLQEEQTDVESRERESWDQQTNARASVPPHPDQPAGMTSQEWSDLQLALQLQEEEQRQQLQRQQQQQQQQQQQHQARQPADIISRGSPSHMPSNPSQAMQSHTQANPSQEQGGTQQNKECTIL